MSSQAANHQPLPTWFLLFRAVISFALGWFRWTQLTAMAAMWGFAVLMVAALFLLSDMEQTERGMESFMVWLLNAPLIGPWLQPYLLEEGGESLTLDDLKSFLFWTWTLGALAAAALAAVVNRVFGPFEPWSLKKKLGIALAACVVLIIAFAMAISLLDLGEGQGGSPWITGIFLFVFLLGISAWALTISHVIGLIQKGLAQARVAEAPQA